jgi:hypothetical protein
MEEGILPFKINGGTYAKRAKAPHFRRAVAILTCHLLDKVPVSDTSMTWTVSRAGGVGAACGTISARADSASRRPVSFVAGSDRGNEQRGGPYQVSFGQRNNRGGGCGFVKHQPEQRFCSGVWYKTFDHKRDGSFEHDS